MASALFFFFSKNSSSLALRSSSSFLHRAHTSPLLQQQQIVCFSSLISPLRSQSQSQSESWSPSPSPSSSSLPSSPSLSNSQPWLPSFPLTKARFSAQQYRGLLLVSGSYRTAKRAFSSSSAARSSKDPVPQSSVDDNRIPVTVITGFLGAGKVSETVFSTVFLCQLLSPHNALSQSLQSRLLYIYKEMQLFR